MRQLNLKNISSKRNFSTSETILLVVMSLLIGLSIGIFLNKNNSIQSTKIDDKYLNEFIKNYNYINDNYYQEIDKEELINGAISGMMKSLDDPYSMYFDESESNNFSITLDGSYQGLGIQISKDEDTGYMLITSVFKDSPAEESGLKVGDLIVSIDSNLSKDLTSSEFSTLIRNSASTSYLLKILRDSDEFEVKINREMVVLTSVASNYYEINNKKIGYIYIGIFANNTYEQFKKELDILEDKNIDSLIIDVRGNNGGHLTAVDEILDIFLNSNQIMYGFEQNGEKTFVNASGKENKNYDIVLLGDESSASASEVLISSLKENLDSVFIGKKTYGKGTAQELVTLSDGTKYKITTKKWLTPNGNWVNDTEGILPDIEVELSSKYYESSDEKDDTQLQEALNYIKNK